MAADFGSIDLWDLFNPDLEKGRTVQCESLLTLVHYLFSAGSRDISVHSPKRTGIPSVIVTITGPMTVDGRVLKVSRRTFRSEVRRRLSREDQIRFVGRLVEFVDSNLVHEIFGSPADEPARRERSARRGVRDAGPS